jgi:hypothetical protein
MLAIVLIATIFVLVPSVAFAWGPLTHVYLGSEIFYLGPLLPPAVLGLMRRYRQDFLYGNLMADTILAKKYICKKKNSHSWDVAVGLYDSAGTDSERAFCLGYLSHLAADTVAHGRFTAGRKNIGHALLEIKADWCVDRVYWYQAFAIRKRVRTRNDAFLEKSLERVIFSFKTNRRIFRGVVALSGLNNVGFGNLKDRGMISLEQRSLIERLHEESLDRILDVLRNGTSSDVLKEDPFGHIRRRRALVAKP